MKKITILLIFFVSFESLALAQNAYQGNRTINNQTNNNKNVVAPTPVKKNTITNAPQPSIQNGSNSRMPAPILPNKAPKLSPQEQAVINKNLAEQKDFEISMKKFTPAQLNKFQSINKNFNSKMIEYSKILNDETFLISKTQNLIVINSYILKGTNDFGNRVLTKEQQDFYQKQINIYNQLSGDKKKAIKQSLIKFRKNINALEKNRRGQFKILFKRDFEMFKERETEEQINNDDK